MTTQPRKEGCFHYQIKIHGRSAGANAVAAAAYRGGSRLLCQRTGSTKNYCRKTEVAASGIMLPANAPTWMGNRSVLWNAVESIENRRDSQLFREIVVALPLEFSLDQQVKLLTNYLRRSFISRGMIADWNIHSKEGNPHAHVMLTLRSVDANGFGPKCRAWNEHELTMTYRKSWAKCVNRSYAAIGLPTRIDWRSFEERGIDAIPTIHLGRRSGDGKSWDRKARFNRLARATRPGTPLPSGYGGSDGDGTGGCGGVGGSGGGGKPKVTPRGGDPLGTGAAYSQVSDTDWKY